MIALDETVDRPALGETFALHYYERALARGPHAVGGAELRAEHHSK